MEGGREAWDEDGGDWSTEVQEPGASTYERGEGRPELIVSLPELEELVGGDHTVILDVRSPEEYSGERFWPSGATEDVGRAGHVPGAIHVPVDVIRGRGRATPIPRRSGGSTPAQGSSPSAG